MSTSTDDERLLRLSQAAQLLRTACHPLYFGFLLAFWMTPTMTLAHLVFALATTGHILVAIQLEERDLVAEYGIAYETYRRRAPMLIPGATSRTS